MTRTRILDRGSGELIAEIDLDVSGFAVAEPGATRAGADLQAGPAHATPALAAPEPGDRPVVLAGVRGPTARGRRAFEVVVGGWRFELEAEDADHADLRARASGGRSSAAHDGPTEVRAIIPGRVVSVAVVSGDLVTAGQRLLAVEAMKMENELRAPRDGTVERVSVAVGQTVELGDSLVVIR